MRIKLAILEKDPNYLNRIVNVFSTKYADKFIIYSFTDKEVAFNTLESTKVDVLVASDVFEIEPQKLPKHCAFAYFVDSADVGTYNDQRAICKFQKADLIYKQILSIYSENAGSATGLKLGDDNGKIITFQPVSGGVGASSMAAACATFLASKGYKTLYLNLEKFGSSDSFFEAEGQFDMSDIIFALKSRKANLAMKLESCVKRADNGVCFYSKSKVALDMLELSYEDEIRVLTELQLVGSYDYIIVDMDFSISKETLKVLGKANTIVWVGDGSDVSNTKLFRAYEALGIIDQGDDYGVLRNIVLIYNKFSNKTCKILDNVDFRNIGGAPRFEHATTSQVLQQLSAMEMFEKLI